MRMIGESEGKGKVRVTEGWGRERKEGKGGRDFKGKEGNE